MREMPVCPCFPCFPCFPAAEMREMPVCPCFPLFSINSQWCRLCITMATNAVSVKLSGVRPYLRWLHELTFATYVSLIVTLVKANVEQPVLFNRMAYPIHQLYRLLSYWHVLQVPARGSVPTEGDRHLVFVVALWTGILFVLLHILERIPVIGSHFVFLTGFVIVVALPWFGSLDAGGLSGLSPAQIRWMWAELVLTAFCFLLYTYRAWPPSSVLFMLVIMHFSLWSWLETYWQEYALFVIATGVIWVCYVK